MTTRRSLTIAAAAMLSVAVAGLDRSAAAHDGETIERLSADGGTIKLGFRTDAAPFASLVDDEPVGYSVDLCRAAGEAVQRSMIDQAIAIEFVPVAAEERFEALADGAIDILCGATTITLDRRRTMDFSLLTYVTGGVLLVPKSEEVFGDVASTVGVLSGTTSESSLNRILAFSGRAVDVVPVESHDDGLGLLQAGDVDAYFGDRVLLAQMMADAPGVFTISEAVQTFEPYALAMRRGEDALRLLVDRALARLYRTGDIYDIHEAAFGDRNPPREVAAIFEMMALEDE